MKKLIFIIVIIIVLGVSGLTAWQYLNYERLKNLSDVSNFEECMTKGNLVLESYPRQCRTPDGKTFVEDIGNELEKTNLVRVQTPRPNDKVLSPLEIKGEARGHWFFEASFPIKLIDGNGNEIAHGIAQAASDWMTENFVPFQAKIEFQYPETKKGTLILEKDNPSGLPENADELKIPVTFYK
jgi:hypothetical protein